MRIVLSMTDSLFCSKKYVDYYVRHRKCVGEREGHEIHSVLIKGPKWLQYCTSLLDEDAGLFGITAYRYSTDTNHSSQNLRPLSKLTSLYCTYSVLYCMWAWEIAILGCVILNNKRTRKTIRLWQLRYDVRLQIRTEDVHHRWRTY